MACDSRKEEATIVKGGSVEPSDFGGLQILDYTAGQDTQSSLVVVRVPPGIQHRHAFSERSHKCYYVVAGDTLMTLGEEHHHLSARDFCLIARGQHLRYANKSTEVATLLLLHTPSFDLDSEIFPGDNGT